MCSIRIWSGPKTAIRTRARSGRRGTAGLLPFFGPQFCFKIDENRTLGITCVFYVLRNIDAFIIAGFCSTHPDRIGLSPYYYYHHHHQHHRRRREHPRGAIAGRRAAIFSSHNKNNNTHTRDSNNVWITHTL